MKLKKNDIILIVALLILSGICFVYLFFLRPSGDTVRVTIDGELYGIFSLSDNITENIISSTNTEQVNRLVINGGKAQVEHASCPDGICVSHRPIFRDGESIVCLPNRVVITVIGSDDNSPDLVS